MATKVTLDDKIFSELEEYGKQLNKMETRVVKDLGMRAPSWVAQETANVYNIKKAEMTKAGKGVKKPWGEGEERFKKAGVGSTSGESVGSFTITYRGRLLSPFHFSVTPKQRGLAPSKAKKKKAAAMTTKTYTMKAAIKKGGKQTLGQYKRTRTRGGPYSGKTGGLFMINHGQVPGERKSGNRKDVDAWKTLSVPQMVGNEEVEEAYSNRLIDETQKLMDKYYAMYVK